MAHRAQGLNDIFEHNVTVRENLHATGGTIQNDPVNNSDIVNKKYLTQQSLNNVRFNIMNRVYEVIIRVEPGEDTIQDALDLITDATSSKKYLLYLANGTYTQTKEIEALHYVDIMGESRDGVILENDNEDYDTLDVGGINCMISTMTIKHESDAGATPNKYPIHADTNNFGDATPVENRNSTTILHNLVVEATGTNAKAGLGIGTWPLQRYYVIDCDISSTLVMGVNCHNSNSATGNSAIYYINTNVTGATYGISYLNFDSGMDGDVIAIYGGKIRGGSGEDIRVADYVSYVGADETWVMIDDTCDYRTISLIDEDKLITANYALPMPTQVDQAWREYSGPITVSNAGAMLTDDTIRVRNFDGIGGEASFKFSTYSDSPTGDTAQVGVENMDGNAKTNMFWKLHTGSALPEVMRLDYNGNLEVQGTFEANGRMFTSGNIQSTGGIISVPGGQRIDVSTGYSNSYFDQDKITTSRQYFDVQNTNANGYLDIALSNASNSTGKIRFYHHNTLAGDIDTNFDLKMVGRVMEAGTFAEIYVNNGSTSQTIPTGATYTKITGFTTDGQSSNCTADASNDKITITKTGRYFVNAFFNGSIDTANTEFEGSIFLGGTEQTNIHCSNQFVAADKNCGSCISGIIDVTSINTDLDFRVKHDDGGNVDFTLVNGNISVSYLGET